VTRRGKPFACISPFIDDEFELKPFQQVWKDIEKTLERTEPDFKSWKLEGGHEMVEKMGLAFIDSNVFVIDLRYKRDRNYQ